MTHGLQRNVDTNVNAARIVAESMASNASASLRFGLVWRDSALQSNKKRGTPQGDVPLSGCSESKIR